MLRNITLKLIEKKFDTENSSILNFSYDADIKEVVCGQHITLIKTLNNQEVRRSYSLLDSGAKGVFSIAVKRVEGGIFSNWILDELEIGQNIDAIEPAGSFYNDSVGLDNETILAITVGSGITPIYAISEYILETFPNKKLILFYGNRTRREVMLSDYLVNLKNRFKDRLLIYYFYSQVASFTKQIDGRMDVEKIINIIKHNNISSVKDCFLCGPTDLLRDFSVGLKDNFEGIKLHQETYHADTIPILPVNANITKNSDITAIINGSLYKINNIDPSITILDNLINKSINVDYSCKSGICSACKCKIIEGKVKNVEDFSLTDDDRQQKIILSCCSFPDSNNLVISFDL